MSELNFQYKDIILWKWWHWMLCLLVIRSNKKSVAAILRTPLGLPTAVLNWDVSWSQTSKWIEMTNLGLNIGVLNREVSSWQWCPMREVNRMPWHCAVLIETTAEEWKQIDFYWVIWSNVRKYMYMSLSLNDLILTYHQMIAYVIWLASFVNLPSVLREMHCQLPLQGPLLLWENKMYVPILQLTWS
jgi:hypothetical protein